MCLSSYAIKTRLHLTDSLVALICGIFLKIVGIKVSIENEDFQLEFARICVGLQVMTTGISLPENYIKKNWKSQMILLGPVLTFGWLICSIFMMIVPNIEWLEALMISACISPTDPVLANAITTGPFALKYIPESLRTLLSFESGANDGLGYPFLFLPIYLYQLSTAEAFTKWFHFIILYNVLLSIAIGAVIGFILNKICKFSHSKNKLSFDYLEIFTVAVSITVLGIVGVANSDDILAVFVCGVVFNRDGFLKKEWELDFAEGVDTLLNVVFFLFLGSILPIEEWVSSSYFQFSQLFLISILVLLFKRLPIVLLYKFIPAIKNYKEAIFVQWFGPMGVSSLFYCLVLIKESSHMRDIAYPIVTFIIFMSVLLHGISVPFILLSDKVATIFNVNCSLLWAPIDEETDQVHIA